MTQPPPPTRRVFLVRHANAGWALPGTRDFDRGLDAAGRDEAAQLAATMAINGFRPDRIYCSPARRCVETLEVLSSRLGPFPAVEQREALYLESHQAYLDLITDDHTDAGSIMIIGHNPMLEDTALVLLSGDPATSEEALGMGFPTAGLMIADCASGADPGEPGNATFIALMSPVDA